MKKISVLLLAALWGFAAPAAGQAVLGFHGGVNIADLGGDDVSDTDTRTGLNVGASVLFPLSGNWGLYLEGSYSEKGAEFSDVDGSGALNLDYLEFPVLLRYGIPTSGPVGFHLYGGGALSFELTCELEGSGGGITATADCEDVDVETKTTDFGLMGGAGIDFRVAEGITGVLDAFYNLGLTSIDDSAADDDVKNRTFTIRAGVAIPLG
ncbi:MAG: porin family protein [Longimicrobiales bacterium]|nr:porin family protein [Longimicrobiales bacterium]